MQRYFCETLDGIIKGDDAKHMIKVMRMKIDDEFIVCANGICHLAHITKLETHVYYELDTLLETTPFPHITLFQGMPKYSKIDDVIKYATIFGVSQITFTQMERSEAKVSQIESKIDRHLKISKEAAELAHKDRYAKISFIKSFDKIQFEDYDYFLFADEVTKSEITPYPFTRIHASDKIAILIGPEGGITEKERTYLKSKSAYQISLGPYILPTQMANLYIISVISAKFMNFFDKQ